MLGYRPDAMQVMTAFDIFVLASRFEGYPIAVMEAIASGLPVVATRVGGLPLAVTEDVNGYLVPPGRSDLLAERILRVAYDPAVRARMAGAARERGVQFDIRPAVRAIERIYWSLSRSQEGQRLAGR